MTHQPPNASEPVSRLEQAYVGLLVEVFRMNGDHLAVGNTIGAELGLNSARWQVLGAIALSPVALPVAHIARNMGLTRQAVQHTVDDMRAEGLVRLETNPYHRRAMLVTMTDNGEAAYRTAGERHGKWADTITAGLSPERIEDAAELLREIQRRIAASPPPKQHQD